VLTELPRPAHLVYRRLLRPRYEAQRRWQPARSSSHRLSPQGSQARVDQVVPSTAPDRRRKRIRAGTLCRDRGRDHAVYR
jgi:hypothetical protein